MNNVNEIETTPQFIDDQRDWLKEYKASTGYSWSKLESPIGRSGTTLSAFVNGSYNKSLHEGGNDKIATEVYRYRQTLVAQAQLRTDAPDIPGYYETRTSRELTTLLTWAHRGRIGVVATNPGLGKTKTLEHYQQCASNVFIITCRPSLKTVTGLCTTVLHAVGNKSARGSAERLSQWVMTEVRNMRGLLLFDDAQHLTTEQIEEIRGWYDQTGVGVVFLGNFETIARMEGGSRSAAFAQIYSRVGMKMIRNQPLDEDVECLAGAWQVEDDNVVVYLKMIAAKPGGLRSCTFAMELASLIAHSRSEALTRDHLAQAWAQLSQRPMAA